MPLSSISHLRYQPHHFPSRFAECPAMLPPSYGLSQWARKGLQFVFVDATLKKDPDGRRAEQGLMSGVGAVLNQKCRFLLLRRHVLVASPFPCSC